MTFSAHVDGGTGAGSKRPKLPANTIPWECACKEPPFEKGSKFNPGYLVKCIDCGTPRP